MISEDYYELIVQCNSQEQNDDDDDFKPVKKNRADCLLLPFQLAEW